jgi:hypothetical protein
MQKRLVLLGAGALALVLAIIATVAAMEGGSSSAQARRPSAATAPPPDVAAFPAGTYAKEPTAQQGSNTAPASVLADGTYPTYVKGVDVQGATITVDVLQVFEDGEAVQAAIEDGVSPDEAAMQYLYIRNENPRLRTLPVTADVQIHFIGSCEGTSDRDALLSELKDATTLFTTLYYYDITVRNGAIHQIAEHLAKPAC